MTNETTAAGLAVTNKVCDGFSNELSQEGPRV